MKGMMIGLGLLLFTATAFGGDTCNYIRDKTWNTENWEMECTVVQGVDSGTTVILEGRSEAKFIGELNNLTFEMNFKLRSTNLRPSLSVSVNPFTLRVSCNSGSIDVKRDEQHSLRMVIQRKEGPLEVRSGYFKPFTANPIKLNCSFSKQTFN